MIEFEVPGEPASKARARFTGRGSRVRTYTPERTLQAERAMAAAYLKATRRTNKADSRTAFVVEAEFHLTKNQRRDVDNMLKLVLDGLNEVAWADDSQVIRVVGEKFYHSVTPRTVVRIIDRGEVPRSEGTCANCGERFPRPPSHNKKKFCTPECRREAARKRRTKPCEHCGKDFTQWGDVQQRRFCSIECTAEARRVQVVCAECGTSFSRARHLNRSGNAYCSEPCKANYWRKRRRSAPKGTCQDCGGPTTKAHYKRCRDCSYAAGGRWADRDTASVTCPICHSFVKDGSTCARPHSDKDPA